jgi:hypothetical protein
VNDIDLFDPDGYPTEEALERITAWPFTTFQDAIDAMDFAGTLWSYPDAWTVDKAFIDPDWPNSPPERRYVFSTGGWSGNESVIEAIQENLMVESLGAWSWRRGGHYEYRFPLPEVTP